VHRKALLNNSPRHSRRVHSPRLQRRRLSRSRLQRRLHSPPHTPSAPPEAAPGETKLPPSESKPLPQIFVALLQKRKREAGSVTRVPDALSIT
jgi:hypothetical protein